MEPAPAAAAEVAPVLPTYPALTVGDRAPNFVLPGADGRVWMFYERVRGGPCILLFYDRNEPVAQRSAVAALAAARERLAAAGVEVFAVNRDSVEANSATVAADGIGFQLFADLKGAITKGYLEAAGFAPGATVWFLLDPNQRILDLRAGGEELLDWALGRLAERSRPAAAAALSRIAPVLVVPEVLDRAACDFLIDRWAREGHFEGEVSSMIGGEETRRVHNTMKSRRDHQLVEPGLLGRVRGLIGRRLGPELRKAFNFDGIKFDRFLIACYDAARGDFFGRHRDNLSPSTAGRRFAMTMNLNAGEYEGGELVFPEYGLQRYSAGSGDAIVFSCSLMHEALPVTRGRRFALLTFLRDPHPAAPRAERR